MRNDHELYFSSTDAYDGKQPEHPAYTYELDNHLGTLANLKELLLEGRPICPYHLRKNHRCKENWLLANMLFVDIDSGMHLKTALRQFRDNAVLIYTSANHQLEKNGIVCDRFRIVFILPETVKDAALITLFNHCAIAYFEHDPKAASYIQGYQTPTQSLLYRLNAENRLDVIELVNKYFSELPLTRAIKVVNQLEGSHSLSRGGFNDILTGYFEQIKDIFPQSYKVYIELWKNLLPQLYPPLSPKPEYHQRIRNQLHYEFDYLRLHCLLIQNIMTTDFREILHIARNLIYLEGGRKQFLDMTKDRPIQGGIFDSYEEIMTLLKEMPMPPTTCEKYCKYYQNGCPVSPKNIIQAQRLKIGEVRRTEEISTTPVNIEYARSWLRETLADILESI